MAKNQYELEKPKSDLPEEGEKKKDLSQTLLDLDNLLRSNQKVNKRIQITMILLSIVSTVCVLYEVFCYDSNIDIINNRKNHEFDTDSIENRR